MLAKSALYALFLALLVSGAKLYAQDASGAGPDRDTEADEQADRPDSGPGQDPLPQASAAPDKAAGDPFEYESSEQISEDLSVSFPVDI